MIDRYFVHCGRADRLGEDTLQNVEHHSSDKLVVVPICSKYLYLEIVSVLRTLSIVGQYAVRFLSPLV